MKLLLSHADILTLENDEWLTLHNAYLGVDVPAILHRDSGVGVNTLEGNNQRSEGVVYLLLQRGAEFSGRRCDNITDLKHVII